VKEQIISVTEAARGFSDLVNRVRYRNESATLTKNGVPVARLIPAGPPPITLGEFFERFKPGTYLSPAEADAFARDLEKGLKFLKPVRSPWD
jgi:prevent-host-death family protein